MSTTSATDASATSRRRSKRTLARLLLAVIVLALAVAGIPWYLHATTHEETDDAFVEAHVVKIAPRVNGHVISVLVEDNQPVRKGDLLLEIDPADYRIALTAAVASEEAAKAAVTEAEASVGAARSRLAQAKAELDSRIASRDQVRAEVAQTKAGFTRDDADLKRTRNLADSGVVSPQEYDHALAARNVSRAKLSAAKRQVRTQTALIAQGQAALSTAEDAMRQAEAKLEAARAELQRAHAQSEQARLNLTHTRLVAPRDGHVAKRTVETGAYVQVGQALMSVVGDDVWVVANFKETQITDMRPGQPVEITLDTYPDVTFPGHVDSIQHGTGSRFTLLPPENASGNYIKVVQRVPVKIVFDADAPVGQYLVTPGMSVVPEVDVSAPGGPGEAMAATGTRLER